jgi:hypothetical protein
LKNASRTCMISQSSDEPPGGKPLMTTRQTPYQIDSSRVHVLI